MRIVILISLLSVFFLSCEKEAHIPIPDQEAKLAVSCFISPGDTVVDVFVFLSEPVFAVHDPNAGVVQNATVILSNGSTSISVPYNSYTGGYHASLSAFPIAYNTTYTLSVSDAQGRHTSAATTTPSAIFPSFEVSQTKSTDPDNETHYNVNCKISDISGEENYYRVRCATVGYDTLAADTTIYAEGENVYLKDHSNDGNTLSVNIEIYSNHQDSAIYHARRVTVIKCNKDYFLFHSSIKIGFDSGNPFAEPALVYSNMDGGYGCFGAYIMRYKDIPY